MADRSVMGSETPLFVEVQRLFCSGGLLNHSVTTIDDPKRLKAIEFAIHSGQTAAIAAIRTARLIDFGVISPCRISGVGTATTSPPFDGEPTAYTFVVPETKCSRAGRIMVVADPRTRMCSAFQIISTADGTRSRWLSTSINEEVFAESPSIAEAFDGAAWATDLAQLVALAKLESIPAPIDENRSRRVRGLPPLPGYFKASLPSPSDAKCCAPQGGYHTSPKPHLRRGHSRRLSDGRIVPVRPCINPCGGPGVGARLHATHGEM